MDLNQKVSLEGFRLGKVGKRTEKKTMKPRELKKFAKKKVFCSIFKVKSISVQFFKKCRKLRAF